MSRLLYVDLDTVFANAVWSLVNESDGITPYEIFNLTPPNDSDEVDSEELYLAMKKDIIDHIIQILGNAGVRVSMSDLLDSSRHESQQISGPKNESLRRNERMDSFGFRNRSLRENYNRLLNTSNR